MCWILLVSQSKAGAMPSCSLGDRETGGLQGPAPVTPPNGQVALGQSLNPICDMAMMVMATAES